MDVINSNTLDGINKKKHKRHTRINAKIKQFSMEIYFMWFSALIFFAETFVGECVWSVDVVGDFVIFRRNSIV